MHPKLAEKKNFGHLFLGQNWAVFGPKWLFSDQNSKKKVKNSKFPKNFIFLGFEGKKLSFASQFPQNAPQIMIFRHFRPFLDLLRHVTAIKESLLIRLCAQAPSRPQAVHCMSGTAVAPPKLPSKLPPKFGSFCHGGPLMCLLRCPPSI